MAGRRFDVADVVEVLQHWQAGRSVRHLARSLGMGRVRVRQIVEAATAAGLTPGAPLLTRAEWEARVPALFAERVGPAISDQRERLERFHDAITEGLATNTAQTVWQRLHDERGLDVSVRTFRRYVQERVEGVRRERVRVRQPATPPGEVAEVDYGRLGLWVDPITGRRRTINGFVMTLACSRHVFVEAVDRCDQASWVASHVAAFAFFGGAPRVLRLDNLKTGVLRADIYDPQLNRAYAEMAEHYGVLLDPCRQGHPRDKPRVERTVPYARDSYWKGRDFGDRTQMWTGGLRWCTDVAGARPHRTLPGTVLEVFHDLELPALLALPETAFEIAHWATATVHADCHVQVRGRFFSVPWRHIGKRLDVRVGERLVTVYEGGVLVKTHLLQHGVRRYTDPADLPEEKVAFLQRTPAWCRRRAGELGPAVLELVEALLAEPPHPLTKLRQAQAVLRLHDTFGSARLDVACRKALNADGSYRTVKNILANALDVVDEEAVTHVSSAGAYLHGAQLLLGEVRS